MTKLREIHFYENRFFGYMALSDDSIMTCDYASTEFYLTAPEKDKLVTIQMCFLSDMGEYMKKGVKVFIHDSTGTYEIKLGADNERTKRELRPSHNFFKMWKEGAFKDKVEQ